MTAHDHPAYVPGCYRCDLSRDEVAMIERDDVREALRRVVHEALVTAEPPIRFDEAVADALLTSEAVARIKAEARAEVVAAVERVLDKFVGRQPHNCGLPDLIRAALVDAEPEGQR